MTNHVPQPSTAVEVIPATREQEPILANLLELYIHDFSELLDAKLGPDGRFGYPRLRLYWSEPGRHPMLVKAAGRWAGFALVKRGSEISGDPDVWDMAEFFVLRGYRRQGVGTQIAQDVWRQFPGRWQVRVMQSNIAAQLFWERAIASLIGAVIRPAVFEKDGECWRYFSFESRY